MLLAGDIGGTKTALGVFSEEHGPHVAIAESEVHSADYASLESIAKEFLAKTALKVAATVAPAKGAAGKFALFSPKNKGHGLDWGHDKDPVPQ